jgi:DNA-binding LacI/PurR family transcriptional regulator
VREAIEALRYWPNSIARGLRLGETKTIGLLVPERLFRPSFNRKRRCILLRLF